jgi:hypothetical protein
MNGLKAQTQTQADPGSQGATQTVRLTQGPNPGSDGGHSGFRSEPDRSD